MSDDDRPGSQGESGNPNSRLLTQRHMGLEQACLLDELAKKSLESRKNHRISRTPARSQSDTPSPTTHRRIPRYARTRSTSVIYSRYRI